MYLPKGFKLIRKLDNLIEFRSKYHYWLLLQNPRNPQTYVVYHKHQYNADYHRQFENPLEFALAIDMIKKHDAYVGDVRFKK